MNEPTSENAVPMVETPQEQWFGNGVFAAHATDGSPNIAAHSHHLADNGPYSCKEEAGAHAPMSNFAPWVIPRCMPELAVRPIAFSGSSGRY
jgi:hypothetical protein